MSLFQDEKLQFKPLNLQLKKAEERADSTAIPYFRSSNKAEERADSTAIQYFRSSN